MLLFDQFFADKDVQLAMDTILNRLQAYQQNITGVQPSDANFEQTFSKLIESIESVRGSLFYPYLSSGFGKGPYVEVADGSIKLDFISGIGVHWAHSDPAIIKASLKAAVHDSVMQGNLQQHRGSVDLYQALCEVSELDHVFLTSSGVMGVENALKLCFQYKSPAKRILSFSNCFCGRTLAAASITDKSQYREGLPIVLPVDYIPFYDPVDSAASIQRSVRCLQDYIKRYPNDYACMKFELIQGEGGFNVGTKAFFKALINCLKEADIPVYIDETQTFGRTTELFAFQLFDLQDDVDIVSIGKMSQVCATLYRKHLKPKPGLISQTFTSSTTAIEASYVILNELVSNDYFGNDGKIAQLHAYFIQKLHGLSKKYPADISDFRGVGSMIAFKLCDGNREESLLFIKTCYKNGLILFVAGNNPTYIRFLLPIGGVNCAHIDEAIDIIDRSISDIKEELDI
ncbi:acetylornithine aminotransferase [Candidatus Marinamargulisbacteria bacterium SCGC AG-333-B06]|nr:acetylornithine aminotransferase [Candidatus Marinamargulisbacteria bacterium SCGC AG-333-B06]